MTTPHRTYSTRGYLTRGGHARLDEAFRACARLYNAAKEHRVSAWKHSSRQPVTYFDQCSELTALRAEDPYWNSMSLGVARGVIRRLDKAFQAFYRRCGRGEKPGYPRWASGRRWKTIEVHNPTPAMVSDKMGKLVVCVKGLPIIRIRPSRDLPDSKRLVALTITRKPTGVWVNMTYKIDDEKQKGGRWDAPGESQNFSHDSGTIRSDTVAVAPGIGCEPNQRGIAETYATVAVAPGIGCEPNRSMSRANQRSVAVGLDLGVSKRVTLSNGETIRRRPRDDTKQVQLERRIARCRRNSNNQRKLRGQLARLRFRESIANRNECHRITTALARRFSFIAVEDLKTKNMTRSAKGSVEKPGKNVAAKSGLNRSILEQSWGIIISQLEYKTEWAGTTLVKVDPRHTSQRCSGCGMVDGSNRRGERYNCGRCGLAMDADVNAARNVLARAA